jgi:hypothetical protein
VNVELQPQHPNSALDYTKLGFYAQPMFYGLALFARTLGPGSSLMQVSEQGDVPGLKVWAVRVRYATLHLLYINKSSRPAWVTLNVPSAARPASLERLIAPSIYANNTVTLAGQRLGPDGLWHGRRAALKVSPRNRSFRVWIPAFSAALLTVPPATSR